MFRGGVHGRVCLIVVVIKYKGKTSKNENKGKKAGVWTVTVSDTLALP